MSESILPLVTLPVKDQKAVAGTAEMELCCRPTYVAIESLTVESEECGVDTIFPANKPFKVSSKIRFSGAGALAVMALNVPMQIRYTAESYGPGDEEIIATVNLTTQAGKLEYAADALVPAGQLTGDTLYRISVLFRMGAAGSNLSIANGYASGILVEPFN